MKILGMDYETTWTEPVNPKQARPLEIGAVLYDMEEDKPLRLYSEMIYEDDHPESPEPLVKLTGITDKMRMDYGVSTREAHNAFNGLMKQADFIVAHNGNVFDKIIYESECERIGLQKVEKEWIDTKVDVPYPPEIKTTKLTYLCTEHLFLNPFAHRALFDVLSMIEILKKYDINEVIELAKQPTFKVVANVSYHDRQQAKDRGYHWDGENKQWTKIVKQAKAEQEEKEAPFRVVLVETNL